MPDESWPGARLPSCRRHKVRLCRVSRRPGDYAMAMALAVLRLDGRGHRGARRLGGAAEALPDRGGRGAVLRAAPGEAVTALRRGGGSGTLPLVDPTDAQYRRELVGAMVYRAVERACAGGAAA